MKFREISRDAVGVVGAGLLTWGVGMIYRPAGFIVAGALLLAACWLLAADPAAK